MQFGGQTPLKLADALQAEGIPILGTSPDAIDLAEDRERFSALLQKLGLKQPNNGTARSEAEAMQIAKRVGYPLVIRPSYVLGGRAMEIVRDDEHLARYIATAVHVSGDSPVLLDSYLTDATEVDVDAICDGTDVHVAGVMEHIEEAGVHSGDSACSLPPYSLGRDVIEEMKRQTAKMALALGVIGLMNVQFAIKDGVIYVLEVNPRASRTVPFVAKATGSAVAAIAARVMAGEKLASFTLTPSPLPQAGEGGRRPGEGRPKPHLASPDTQRFAVKEAVMPFARFPGVDTLLGPEMRSTGEVMGSDAKFSIAFLKSQMGAGVDLPNSGTCFISIKDADKGALILDAARIITELGFEIIATRGTRDFLARHRIPAKAINKVYEGRPDIVDAMKDGKVQLVFNTTEGTQSISDSRGIRSVALYDRIPYYTTAAGARAAAMAMRDRGVGELEVRALQEGR